MTGLPLKIALLEEELLSELLGVSAGLWTRADGDGTGHWCF